MKLNWKVRAKNPYFWIGLIGMFFCAIGVDSSTLTTWGALIEQLKELISNPYLIGSVVIAFIGYVPNKIATIIATVLVVKYALTIP